MPYDLPNTDNFVEYVMSVVKKEVKGEDRLPRQLLYIGLSAFTNDPLNLAINAPTGEGKNHVIRHVLSLFPSEDVSFLNAMTEKAIFHKAGKIVVDTGTRTKERYKPIDEQVEKLKEEIGQLKFALKNAEKDQEKEKDDLKIKLETKKSELRELTKDAKKLIDLNNKILVLLDTPSQKLFAALMSLLSHDSYFAEYDYVDTAHGIKTKTNILAGYPAVVFAAAVDYSEWNRYPEVQRRFIITNPKMTPEKYREANMLTAARHGLPSVLYEQAVVTEGEKELARNCIKYLKEEILNIAKAYDSKHAISYIPFRNAIAESMPTRKGTDMTTANRFFSFLGLLPVINYAKRPKVRINNKLYPIALFEDMGETMRLMEYSDGARPYIIEWYNEVFLPLFLTKSEPDRKKDSKGEEKEEDRTAVTSNQLVEYTRLKQQKTFTTKQLYERYLQPLHNEGYIDKERSKIDNRQYIYYPIINAKINKLVESSSTINFSYQYKIQVSNPDIFPSKNMLKLEFSGILKHCSASYKDGDFSNILVDIDGYQVSLEKILAYFNHTDDYFLLVNNTSSYSMIPFDDVDLSKAHNDYYKKFIEQNYPSNLINFREDIRSSKEVSSNILALGQVIKVADISFTVKHLDCEVHTLICDYCKDYVTLRLYNGQELEQKLNRHIDLFHGDKNG